MMPHWMMLASYDISIEISYDASLDDAGSSLLLKLEDCTNTMQVSTLVSSKTADEGNGNASPLSAEFKYTDESLISENPVLILQSISAAELDMKEVVSAVSTDTLRKHVNEFYGVRNRLYTESLKNLKKTKAYLERYFAMHGMQTYRQIGTFPDYVAHNIIGRKTGLNPDKVIIIGAHLDTTSESPGADDNASGMAGMLELIRIMAPMEFEHTLVFVGLDLEEEGHMGSEAFVDDGGVRGKDEVIGYINFDMIGYYSEAEGSQLVPMVFEQQFPEVTKAVQADGSRGDFVVNIANTRSAHLAEAFEEATRQSVPGLKVHTLTVEGNGKQLSDLRGGDHSSFWDGGYPAISIGDGADTRNPHYHSSEDKLEDLNFEFMTDVTKAALATVIQLAKPLQIRRECKTLDTAPMLTQN